MKNVLFINPPGSKVYNRDYYCGDEAKGSYFWPPTDLLYLSAKTKKFKSYALDCIAEKVTISSALDNIKAINPDVIISLCSSVSLDEDILFLEKCKRLFKCQILVSGDYPRNEPSTFLNDYPFIDAVILNFAINDLDNFLLTNESKLNIYSREQKNDETLVNNFEIGTPQFLIFKLDIYKMPLIKNSPFSTFISEFGCKYSCEFCFYAKTKYVKRSITDIKDELNELNKLGIKNIFINDPSFYSSPDHTEDVLRLISGYNNFSFLCGMRVDNFTDDKALKLKQAGCYAIAFGVETTNNLTQKNINKNINIEKTSESFLIAKKYNIRTLAHFILGLENDNFNDQLEIINYSIKLNPDFATFNIASPVWGSLFRDKLSKKTNTKISPSINISEDQFSWIHPTISNSEIGKIKKMASRKFYLRPFYILKTLSHVKNFYQLKVIIYEGFSFFKSLLSK